MSLLSKLRKELKKAADPDKAPAMRAYMKSDMPYHGVPMPALKKIEKAVFRELDFSSRELWEKQVLEIWRGAKFREERYAALSLCADKRARAYRDPASYPLYQEMILSGAWWDYVDEISQRLGEILREHPAKAKRKMLSWSKSPNFWLRRAAILCQLSFKKETDLELLYACIEPSLSSEEFYLQKAIGWALRQYAWTDPREVLRYVKANEGRLSKLSRREALKNIS